MGPRAMEFGFNESWGVAEALRDHALRSGELARPARLLHEYYRLPQRGPFKLTIASFRPSVQLAHLELLRGDRVTAEERLLAVIRFVDTDRALRPVYKRRARAQALMLLGETDRAMEDLAASFRDDLDYNQWWYTTDHDPVWDSVRNDPRFVAIATDARAFARREAEAVQQLRARGDIPTRPAPAHDPRADGTG
jgi:hypothetical protein